MLEVRGRRDIVGEADGETLNFRLQDCATFRPWSIIDGEFTAKENSKDEKLQCRREARLKKIA